MVAIFSHLKLISPIFTRVLPKIAKRTFLSSSYKCDEAWQQRKKAPIFKKIDYDDLFYQLDRCCQIGTRINILDADLFCNGIESSNHLNELEDILFKIRLNPETGLMPDRTMHAVIRYYLSIGEKEKLLEILSNRLGYGIYPDYYLANLMMDRFLKENDVVSAVKIAVLQMLQEDFGHPITQALSIYSCYRYLNSDAIWQSPKPTLTEDEDEDEIKVRVSFIRNPYFDDHFDLVDTNYLVGKTLLLAGKSLQGGALSLSSQLIGLTLWEKYDKISEYLDKKIHSEAVDKCINYIRKKPKTEEQSEMSEEKTKALEALENFKQTEQCVGGCVEEDAKKAVEAAVTAFEKSDIEKLHQLYAQWENDRENDIQEELFETEKRKTLEIISKTKKEIKEEEQVLFYFDKENEWDLAVEEIKEKQRQLEEYNSQFKSKSKTEESEYIPPEIGRKEAQT